MPRHKDLVLSPKVGAPKGGRTGSRLAQSPHACRPPEPTAAKQLAHTHSRDGQCDPARHKVSNCLKHTMVSTMSDSCRTLCRQGSTHDCCHVLCNKPLFMAIVTHYVIGMCHSCYHSQARSLRPCSYSLEAREHCWI
jgi:hypothetical protein